ncbi:MAG: hypothetical protein PHI29_13315 [Gallionella sp.]|nr:hypothetical protein [Gallionella sp.]
MTKILFWILSAIFSTSAFALQEMPVPNPLGNAVTTPILKTKPPTIRYGGSSLSYSTAAEYCNAQPLNAPMVRVGVTLISGYDYRCMSDYGQYALASHFSACANPPPATGWLTVADTATCPDSPHCPDASWPYIDTPKDLCWKPDCASAPVLNGQYSGDGYPASDITADVCINGCTYSAAVDMVAYGDPTHVLSFYTLTNSSATTSCSVNNVNAYASSETVATCAAKGQFALTVNGVTTCSPTAPINGGGNVSVVPPTPPVDCVAEPNFCQQQCLADPQFCTDHGLNPDGTPNTGGVDCAVTPNDPSCTAPPVDCTVTPNDPSCTAPPVDCTVTPNDPSCTAPPVDCTVTPNDPSCLTGDSVVKTPKILHDQLYKSGDLNGTKTVATVLTSFKNTVLATPLMSSISGFFTVQLSSGACPEWVADTTSLYGRSLRFDFYCSQVLTDLFPWIRAVLLLIFSYVAFKIAIL